MKTTQRSRIIKLLRRGWISPAKAFSCGCGMKLSSRVSGLRQQGYIIADKWGPEKAYKLYYLLKSPGATCY